MKSLVQSLSHLSTEDERASAASSAAGTCTRSDQDPSSTMDRLLSDENIVRNILEQLVPLNHSSFVGTRVGKWRIKGLQARADLNGLEGELIGVQSYAAGRSVAEINDDILQGRVPFLVTLPSGRQQRLSINTRNLEPTFSRPAALRSEVVASRPWLEESRCVCKVWRLAAARPFLAVVLTGNFLGKMELALEMAYDSRAHGRLHSEACSGLSLRATERACWMVGGWENGCNSIARADIDTRHAATAVIKHLQLMEVSGVIRIIAPKCRWPQWRAALAALELPHCEEEEEGSSSAESSRRESVVLTSMHHTNVQKFAVFDEGPSDAGALPWYFETDIATRSGVQGNWLQLTERELPDDVESLLKMARASHWMFSQVMTDESVRAMCAISRALSTGDEDLQQWAYQGFLVPRLQAALHASVWQTSC
jgi:hypothetical protein